MSSNYPGNKVISSRKVMYNAQYNYFRNMLNSNPQENAFFYPTSGQQSQLICLCNSSNIGTFISSPTNQNESNSLRISKLIRQPTNSGKIQYGYGYSGNGLNLNYLGKTHGQAGGSGKPPKNRLR